MIEKEIIFSGRQGGKTYQMMTEIQELIVTGHRSEILVIFPTLEYVHWWTREWQIRFPHVSMVAYTMLTAMDRVRGKVFKYVFIEDIDTQPDGVYSEQLQWLYPSMPEGGTITFSCSPNELSLRSHSQRKTADQVMRERMKRRA